VSVFFSIIIPTFNRALLVREAIASILEQNNIPLEIIVVDDGGGDNTDVVINDFNDRRIKYCKVGNRERGAARNLGLKMSSGRYVNYFDSDDILNPVLTKLYDFIIANNNPPVIYGSIEQMANGKSVGVIQPYTSNFRKSIIHNNFLACGAVFIRSDIATRFLFSEKRALSGAEDWELWLRIYTCHEFSNCKMAIFKQREHVERSLRTANPDKAIARELCFVETIHEERTMLLERFTEAEIDLLLADRFSLLALLYCERKSRDEAILFWKRSYKTSGRVIGRKRFWAVFRKLFFFRG